VWEVVSNAFRQPEVLLEEYRRRLAYTGSSEGFEAERKQVALALKRVRAHEDRLTDAYLNEVIEMDRYKAEMGKLQVRRQELERSAQEVGRRERQVQDATKSLASLDGFCHQVSAGLEATDFEERRRLLELVVERITVEDAKIRVDTVIPIAENDGQLRARHAEPVEA
jgi:site-specific DNA recombinase